MSALAQLVLAVASTWRWLRNGLTRSSTRKTAKSAAIQLVDPKNPVFKPLHRLLDRLYCDLYAQGIGATRRQSEIIMTCDEDKLWETRVMGTDSPQALLFAVLFYNGLNFIL